MNYKIFYGGFDLPPDMKNYLLKYAYFNNTFNQILKYIIKNDHYLKFECWEIWNRHYDRDEYPKYAGGSVSRILWSESRNRKIPRNHIIRHTCDNPKCINPLHLRCGTCQDNSNDMVTRNRSQNGEDHNDAKLKEKDIYDIFDLFINKKMTGSKISKLYNLTENCIYDILSGKTWCHITKNIKVNKHELKTLKKKNQIRNKLTEDDVRNIRRLYSTGNYTKTSLSKHYNTGVTTISNIINYYSWKNI